MLVIGGQDEWQRFAVMPSEGDFILADSLRLSFPSNPIHQRRTKRFARQR